MAESSQETIGERARRLRVARGKSQRDLACPGLSSAYISRIEVGTRVPTATAVRLLARRLGVRPCYLETGSELTEAEHIELRLTAAALAARLNDDRTAMPALSAALTEAEELAESALMVDAQVALGLSALAHGDHEAAIRFLRRAVESKIVSPLTDPNVYNGLAESYAALGHHGQRIAIGGTMAAQRMVTRGRGSERPSPEQVRRLEEWAAAAEKDGKTHVALRARRAALMLLNLTEIDVRAANAILD